jgi:pyruvate dehydrogenase E2 component (dihydrolipoamide acetyltransferase)
MTVAISMPQLGLTMTEATVSAWLKKPGDQVRKDEPILSVSTDKVDMDVESTVDGVLREIVVDAGNTVPVGTPLAYVEAAAGAAQAGIAAKSSAKPADSKPAVEATPAAPQSTPTGSLAANDESPDGRFRASPRAKRRASELGIDITTIKGSGPGGRVVDEDVQALAHTRRAAASPAEPPKRRQLIANRMVESIQTIPAFTVSLEVSAKELAALYQSVGAAVGRQADAKLTYTDLLLRALSLSLADTPEINAVWENGSVHSRNQIDLGLAVATDRGVAAPVITRVDQLPLTQLVVQRSGLTLKARQGRLTFADLEGGTGTLSNLGMYRVDRFEGIITPGQSFILATGKMRERPWVEASTIVARQTLILTLSVDHRVADGAQAAVFLEKIADMIESPYRLLWNQQS